MKRKKLDFPQSILLQAGKLSDLKKKTLLRRVADSFT